MLAPRIRSPHELHIQLCWQPTIHCVQAQTRIEFNTSSMLGYIHIANNRVASQQLRPKLRPKLRQNVRPNVAQMVKQWSRLGGLGDPFLTPEVVRFIVNMHQKFWRKFWSKFWRKLWRKLWRTFGRSFGRSFGRQIVYESKPYLVHQNPLHLYMIPCRMKVTKMEQHPGRSHSELILIRC